MQKQNFSNYISPKIDDFKSWEKIWQKNNMVKNGANLKSKDFLNGFNYALNKYNNH